MFDLAKADVFRDCDVLLTVKVGMNPAKLQVVLDEFEKIGMNVYAYSDRGDHKQYVMVPDIATLRERHNESCRNSLAGVFDAELKTVPIS